MILGLGDVKRVRVLRLLRVLGLFWLFVELGVLAFKMVF